MAKSTGSRAVFASPRVKTTTAIASVSSEERIRCTSGIVVDVLQMVAKSNGMPEHNHDKEEQLSQ